MVLYQIFEIDFKGSGGNVTISVPLYVYAGPVIRAPEMDVPIVGSPTETVGVGFDALGAVAGRISDMNTVPPGIYSVQRNVSSSRIKCHQDHL
jgi:hypothetical protein